MLLLLTLIPLFVVNGQQINTVDVGKTKYFISNLSPYSPKLNWFLAYQYCRNIGMELLTMQREEESNELISYLNANGLSNSDYWTSGNRLGERMWIWMTSGRPFNATFNLWPQGASNQYPENSCAALAGSQLNSRQCSQSNDFICQLTRCYYFNYVSTNNRHRGNAITGRRQQSQPTTVTNHGQTIENEVDTRRRTRHNVNNKDIQADTIGKLRRKEQFSWAFGNTQ